MDDLNWLADPKHPPRLILETTPPAESAGCLGIAVIGFCFSSDVCLLNGSPGVLENSWELGQKQHMFSRCSQSPFGRAGSGQ